MRAAFEQREAIKPELLRVLEIAGESRETESLSCILGSVYDGDPVPLQRLAENPDANPYVRDAALDTFLVLEHSGRMARGITRKIGGMISGHLLEWCQGILVPHLAPNHRNLEKRSGPVLRPSRHAFIPDTTFSL